MSAAHYVIVYQHIDGAQYTSLPHPWPVALTQLRFAMRRHCRWGDARPVRVERAW